MPLNIRPISAADTLSLRAKVLKPFLQPQDCTLEGDDLASTLHLGAFLEDQIVGIATFLPAPHADFLQAHRPYRLRGMATDQPLQRQGVGRQLVEQGQAHLIQLDCDLLWFNARKIAFPFYLALGFEFHGAMFDITQIGPHKVMYKIWPPR